MKDNAEIHSPEEAVPLNTDEESHIQHKRPPRRPTLVIALLTVSTLLNIALAVSILRRSDGRLDTSFYGVYLPGPKGDSQSIRALLDVLISTCSSPAPRCAHKIQFAFSLWLRQHH